MIDNLSEGLIVDGFSLEERLGEGGFGEVWKVCSNAGRLKCMKFACFENHDFLKREADTHLRLGVHNNILSVENFNISGDFAYLLMDYNEGYSSLRKNIGFIDKKDSFKIIKQVAEALSYAHSKDVCHGDIKPENILVNDNYDVKVCDFGLSTFMSDVLESKIKNSNIISQSEGFKGSLLYASPEQLEGKKTDFLSDIYSLNLIFFELLTGKRLGMREHPYNCLNSNGVDEAAIKLISRGLEYDSEKRFSNIEDYLVKLNSIISKEEILPEQNIEESNSKQNADNFISHNHFHKKYELFKKIGFWTMGVIASLAFAGGVGYLLSDALKKNSNENSKYPVGYSYFPEKLTEIIETYGSDPYNYMILYKTVKTEEGLNKKEKIHVAFPEALSVKNESIDKLTGGNGLIQVQIGSESGCYINLGFIREVLNDCEKEQGYVANGWEFRDFLKKKLNTGFYLQAAKDQRIKVPIKYKSTIEDDFDRFMIEDEEEGKYFKLYFKDEKGNEQHMGFTPLFLKDRESKPYEMIDEALNAMKDVYGKDAKVTSDQIFAVYQQLLSYNPKNKEKSNTIPFVDSATIALLNDPQYLFKLKENLGLNK